MFKGLDPFPAMIRRQFRYADIHQLATESSTGNLGSQVRYRMNSLFDPYYTGAGHQPYGYDQLTNIYAKYRVNRISFKATFTTPGGAADVFCAASYSTGTSASLSAYSPHVICEWPNAIHGHLSSSGSRVCVLSGTVNLHDIVTIPKAKYDADDAYSAAVGSDPTQLVLLSFAVGSYSGTGSEATSLLIELEYDAVLYERQVVASS